MHDPHFDESTEMSPSPAATATRHEVRRRLSRRWGRFPGRMRRLLAGEQGRRVLPQDVYRVLSPAQSTAAVNAAWNVTQRLQRQAATASRRKRQGVVIAVGGWLCAAALTAGGVIASQRAQENFDSARAQSQRLVEQMRADRAAALAAIQERNALRGDLLIAHASSQDVTPLTPTRSPPPIAWIDTSR
jgi:hypothetical protein